MRRFVLVLGHVCGWCMVIGVAYMYWKYIAGAAFGNGYDFILFVLFHMMLFYVNVSWLLPKAFRNRRKTVYRLPLYILLEVVVLISLAIGLSLATGSLEVQIDQALPIRIYITNFFHILLPLSVGPLSSLAYYAIYRLYYQEIVILHLTLAWRQAQLSPHLLTNLLSMISGMSRRAPQRAEETITLVKDMMRYYIAENHRGWIPLADEIEQVHRLIRLNELRHGRMLSLIFTVSGPTADIYCIPMLILLLAENIFRHSDLDDPRQPAILNVDIGSDGLSIRSINKIRKDNRPSDGGMGLHNLKDRLAHAYPKAHIFQPKIEDEKYEIYIEIQGIPRIDGSAF